MSIGKYPSLLVTGPRRIKNGDGYLLGYVIPSDSSAVETIQFREQTMTGTEIWGDIGFGTTGGAARHNLPSNGLFFRDALYITGSNFPAKLYVAYM